MTTAPMTPMAARTRLDVAIIIATTIDNADRSIVTGPYGGDSIPKVPPNPRNHVKASLTTTLGRNHVLRSDKQLFMVIILPLA